MVTRGVKKTPNQDPRFIIGSATIVAYDEVPVLTTDAWINGDAYFGSWTHDYEIPAAQMDAIKRAKYHWFSHGHPDHLNIDSLPSLTQGKFLLSDHHGSRIHRELTAEPTVITDLVQRSLQQFPLERNITVRLHPDDLAIVQIERRERIASRALELVEEARRDVAPV